MVEGFGELGVFAVAGELQRYLAGRSAPARPTAVNPERVPQRRRRLPSSKMRSNALRDRADEQARAIIDELAGRGDLPAGSNERKLRDFHASYMDIAGRDAAGIKPLQPVLERYAAIASRADLVAAFANQDIDGGKSPIGLGLGADRKDPDHYLASLGVGGLGLPDRDYYLNPDARFVAIRKAYVAHIERMLGFAGASGADAKARADAVLALETALAKPQWERAKMRDRDKTYNVISFAELQSRYPAYDWNAHLRTQGMPAPDRINVVTPDAVQPILAVIEATPLATWRDYLAFHAIDGNAGLLSQAIDDAAFEFNGKVLGGQKAQRDDWKRALALVGGRAGLGEALGPAPIPAGHLALPPPGLP